jgi:FlaA1/EpsC-like NDP-sugar epimerase
VIRRNGIGFRTLLMLVDASLAVALLGVVSITRFGTQWYDHWLPFLNQPGAFAVLYAAAWVGVLWIHGLYWARARWTVGSEAVALARATVVMAVLTLSLLFVLRLPDISRSFLVILFPAQWAVGLGTRVAVRLAFMRLRERGCNLRYVLVVGTSWGGEPAHSTSRR